MVIETLSILRNLANSLRDFFYFKVQIPTKVENNIVNQFTILYYESRILNKTWSNTFWLGTPARKCPLDLWIYQEIIFKIKPDIIIECGTASGGSALFLASMCDLVNNGQVITIDIEAEQGRPQHKRIKYLLGSSTSEKIIKQVKKLISLDKKVMVVLDSNHKKEHVLYELDIYSKFITKESYIIVEDTIVGHPITTDIGSGPMEAVEEFLKENKNFIIDKTKEKFLMTFNKNGYIKKVK